VVGYALIYIHMQEIVELIHSWRGNVSRMIEWWDMHRQWESF